MLYLILFYSSALSSSWLVILICEFDFIIFIYHLGISFGFALQSALRLLSLRGRSTKCAVPRREPRRGAPRPAAGWAWGAQLMPSSSSIIVLIYHLNLSSSWYIMLILHLDLNSWSIILSFHLGISSCTIITFTYHHLDISSWSIILTLNYHLNHDRWDHHLDL